jgi:hypothetical protein
MKIASAISVAALLAALAVVPATAASLNVGVGLDVGAGVTTDANAGDNGSNTTVSGSAATGVSVSSTGDGSSSLDVNALLRLIGNANYDDDSFSSWTSASATSVINLDDRLDASSNAAIDAAVTANLDEQDDLRAAISANADLSAWLETNGIDATSVIAIDVAADGSVDVYEG